MPAKRMRVHVEGGGQFDACVGRGALSRLGSAISEMGVDYALIVSDETTGPLFESKVVQALHDANISATGVSIPAGRANASADAISALLAEAEDIGVAPGAAVIGLGGTGVCGVSAMLAALYLGGLPYIGIPTTLSAMAVATSGICSVRLPKGLGSISCPSYPAYLICDCMMIDSLAATQAAGGAAVLARNALLGSEESCRWFLSNIEAIGSGDDDAVRDALIKNADTMSRLEAAKPGEMLYGDEFASAILACLPEGETSYGAALGEGMRFSSRLSQALLSASPAFVHSQDAILDALGAPRVQGELTVEGLLDAMPLSSRISGGSYSMSLLRGQGDRVQTVVDGETMKLCLGAWVQARGESQPS